MGERANHTSGERRRRYMSYLLRLWQTQHEGTLVWRASLESAHTGERRGFASQADLVAFLEREIAPVEEGEPRAPADDDIDAPKKVRYRIQ